MSIPSTEARIAAQERLATVLAARIEELSQDMTASFRQVDAYFERIEANMATKEELAELRATQLEHGDLLRQILTRLPKVGD